MSLIKSKIERYSEKFIAENFPRDKRKDSDKKFELFVNSMHCWNTSSQSYHSNSEIGKEISLGDSQGADAFFVLINNRIYSVNDNISEILKTLENKPTTEISFQFIQTKNTQNAKLGDFLKFIAIPLKVIKQQSMPSDANLKKVYTFIQDILQNSNLNNIKHIFELYFYTTKGENEVVKQKSNWKTELDSYRNDLSEFTNVEIDIRGSEYLNNLFELYNSNDYILSVTKNNLKRVVDEDDKSECLIGHISAQELLNCIAPNINGKRVLKSDVFKHNIRLYLGDETSVNEGIEKTLNDEYKLFHLYNNGITITTKEITDQNTYNFSISPVNIVNGCQTANSIFNVCSKDSSFEDKIKIPVKIIRIPDEENTKITIRSNSQNGVSETDLLAITNIQIELETKFKSQKIWDFQFYYKRQNSSNSDNEDFDFTVKIDDILRAFFSSILLIPHKVTAKFNETSNQFLRSVFEDRFISLYFVSTVIYKLIEDVLGEKHKDNQRLKYHLFYLTYRHLNIDAEYAILEKYFKNKNKYYDSEQDYAEKKQEDYENVGRIANQITSSLFNVLKDKKNFYKLVEEVFNKFQTNNKEFFADLSLKQNERIVYKAVSNINFDGVIGNVTK